MAPRTAIEDGAASLLDEAFEIGIVLGKGTFGIVRAATRRADGERVAVKSFDRSGASGASVVKIRREADLLVHLHAPEDQDRHPLCLRLAHPAILASSEPPPPMYHVVTAPVCDGGELYARIAERGRFSERDAAGLARQMLEAIAHCHRRGVVHRDVKPQNLLFARTDVASPLVLVDFGLAVALPPEPSRRRLKLVCGTGAYMAPEVLAESYVELIDVWSVGIIAYTLLAGRQPHQRLDFNFRVHPDVSMRSRAVPPVEYGAEEWAPVSAAGQDFVRSLLERSEAARASAERALGHAWLVRAAGAEADADIERPLPSDRLAGLRAISAREACRRAACRVAAQLLDYEELRAMKLFFVGLDVRSTGTVTRSDLQRRLQDIGNPRHDDEAFVDALFRRVNISGSGEATFDEVLMFTIERRLAAQSSMLWGAAAQIMRTPRQQELGQERGGSDEGGGDIEEIAVPQGALEQALHLQPGTLALLVEAAGIEAPCSDGIRLSAFVRLLRRTMAADSGVLTDFANTLSHRYTGEDDEEDPEADASPFEGVPVHVGVTCDGCGMFPLRGARYKCVDCCPPGVDLCSTCYLTPFQALDAGGRNPARASHTAEHTFRLLAAEASSEA